MINSKIKNENIKKSSPLNIITINEYTNKNINKNNKFILPMAKTTNNFLDESLKNESLATLRKLIKSPKPFLVTSSIRKKIKFIKMSENEALDNFYSSTIKTFSARQEKKAILKKFKENSNSVISKNKKLKLNDNKSNKNLIIENSYKTNYNLKKYKIGKKNSSSNEKKTNFSIFSNSKTDYSTLPTAALTSRNFYKKSNYFDFRSEKNKCYDDDDILGYNNANMKEPTYAKKGTLTSFMNKIKNIRKDNYKNYYLKLYEFKKNILNENILCQIQLDERTKNIANYYLNKYNDGYNIYWYKLKKKINKEYDINDNLKYEIKNLKIEINKLTIKLQKLLIKLSIFDEIRDFLFQLKVFASYPFGTPFNQLMELKNKLMEKIKNNEEQTNLNIYLLNKKEIGIDLFINKYKSSSNNENGDKDILKVIKDFSDVPDKIDSNIKNLLWKQNNLEKEIDSLKLVLYEIIEDSKNEKIIENRIINQYNNFIKIISSLKTENLFLQYKIEYIKKKNKNDKYSNLNDNIVTKIIQIYQNLNKNGYISEDNNFFLSKFFPNYMIRYILSCLSIIEKNIILLLNFKKEVIYKDPVLKKQLELESKYEAVIRKKRKEKYERHKKIKNTVEKLNKIKFINEKKDYYYLNREASINKFNKILREKEKDIIRKKSSVEIIMDMI